MQCIISIKKNSRGIFPGISRFLHVFSRTLPQLESRKQSRGENLLRFVRFVHYFPLNCFAKGDLFYFCTVARRLCSCVGFHTCLHRNRNKFMCLNLNFIPNPFRMTPWGDFGTLFRQFPVWFLLIYDYTNFSTFSELGYPMSNVFYAKILHFTFRTSRDDNLQLFTTLFHVFRTKPLPTTLITPDKIN